MHKLNIGDYISCIGLEYLNGEIPVQPVFLAPLTVAGRLNWFGINSRGNVSQAFLIVTANYLVRIFHCPVRHLDFASIDDRSKDIILYSH